jgi:hypothetical protein
MRINAFTYTAIHSPRISISDILSIFFVFLFIFLKFVIVGCGSWPRRKRGGRLRLFESGL